MTNAIDLEALPAYEVYAIRYGMRPAQRPDNFVRGDPDNRPMPMDYFVWVIRGEQRLFVVDTGFGPKVAAKRARTLFRTPAEGLALLGVNVETVKDVIITHFHYDHIGTNDEFQNARFHLQEDEMVYTTGRHMQYDQLNSGYEVNEVAGMVRLVFENRVKFYVGDAALAPGISIHLIGGHTHGLQCVRVHTQRGWVVLASDTTHYYEHFEKLRVFPSVFDVGEVIDGYEKLLRLADSPRHVIPGHDPLVMERYPAPSPELKGIVVRLDVAPVNC
jgi:glyoxylase-like metal-dependent hydrolase (beta-lactamase superfamily II)